MQTRSHSCKLCGEFREREKRGTRVADARAENLVSVETATVLCRNCKLCADGHNEIDAARDSFSHISYLIASQRSSNLMAALHTLIGRESKRDWAPSGM